VENFLQPGEFEIPNVSLFLASNRAAHATNQIFLTALGSIEDLPLDVHLVATQPVDRARLAKAARHGKNGRRRIAIRNRSGNWIGVRLTLTSQS
jgi:hypothetical protein